jgi:DNA-directed RNA polymerase specialized sigma24 family protein
MARDERIDARLWRWAEWLKSGDGGGYPVKSTLHEDWAPPTPGMRPGMRVAPANDAPQTHSLVHRLSERAIATLTAHYVLRMNPAAAATVLCCQPDTVHARIEAAHRDLAAMLDAAGLRARRAMSIQDL